MLNCGRGKVGRFEAKQWRRPEMGDLRGGLRIEEVAEAEREKLADLAMRAGARPWWRDYSDIFDNEFPGFENDASRIRVFMPLVLPGLLQTAAYVEAFMRAGLRSPAWRRRALETRLRRQEVLGRSDGTAPKLSAVITEASLMYRWGSKADRREQGERLLDAASRPNGWLRIQRFAHGPPVGMHSMVHILDFPGEPAPVCLETDYVIQEVSHNGSADS